MVPFSIILVGEFCVTIYNCKRYKVLNAFISLTAFRTSSLPKMLESRSKQMSKDSDALLRDSIGTMMLGLNVSAVLGTGSKS